MSSYELFTDGACSGNPGPGGWGFILRGGGAAEREESGGEPSTTNNRMELTAVIRGLDELADGSTVVVTTDSEYCVKGLNEWMDGWKKRGWRKADRSPVMNRAAIAWRWRPSIRCAVPVRACACMARRVAHNWRYEHRLSSMGGLRRTAVAAIVAPSP
jgi:ribonuclease HI